MIENLKEAITLVRNLLIERNPNNEFIDVVLTHHDQHCMFESAGGIRYYLLYKRDVFRSFGEIFKCSGVGESINEDALNIALESNIDLFLVVYENGTIYSITPKEWERKGLKRTTEAGEITICIPITALRRWV